ncbi:MAG: hypothetical protein ACLQAH_12725 [Limisphaerales bacterium]
MNGNLRPGGLRCLGFLAVLALSTVSLKANPINPGASPVFELGTITGITLAILAEAVCIMLLLRRWRTPLWFLLWLMAMHLVTYPIFLGLLWLSSGKPPVLSVTVGEGLIVLIEGGLIYLLCRFAPSAKSEMPLPSISKSLFVSLAGNICSAVAFPLVMILFGLIAVSIGALIGR